MTKLIVAFRNTAKSLNKKFSSYLTENTVRVHRKNPLSSDGLSRNIALRILR